MSEKEIEYLGISCTNDEVKSLKLIQNNLLCASQACSPEAIPDNVDKEKAVIFVAGAIEAKSRALWLQDQWWNEVIKKYKLNNTMSNPVYVDFSTCEFYKNKE